eukprot:TRINITY_DN20733_c0_g1_i1.p1 TRINITY_DN20733_c0_g1~~TRINITY_DN20733_c0_g1_i1.p1  ORF type:complete len:609 (+),score=114.18 TRINITY_DN20733_c0_g1_i1:147-1973(+)
MTEEGTLASEIDRLIDELYVEKDGQPHPLKLLHQQMAKNHEAMVSHSSNMLNLVSKQRESFHAMDAETVKILLESKKLRLKVEQLESGQASPDPDAAHEAVLPGAVSGDGPDRAAGGAANKPSKDTSKSNSANEVTNVKKTKIAEGLASIVPQHGPTRSDDHDDKQSTSSMLEVGDGGMFETAAGMKAKLRERLAEEPYHVSQYYWNVGFCQRVARHQLFESVTLFVVALNAIWIWIDTDYNTAEKLIDADAVFIVVENLFCIYFVIELIIRFGAFKKKFNCLKDGWFVFDSFLVFLVIFETWIIGLALSAIINDAKSFGIFSVFRLFRLLRLARMIRLLRKMPQLLVLVKAMAIAMKSVGWALVLLLAIVYVFAVAFALLLNGNDAQPGEFAYDYRTVPVAIRTLIGKGAFPDQFDDLNGAMNVQGKTIPGWGFYLLMVCYLVVSALGVMNMLIGMLCEAISVISQVENDELLFTNLRESLSRIMQETQADIDGSGCLDKDEFTRLNEHAKWIQLMKEVDVDPIALFDLAEFEFESNSELTFADFMTLIMELRGTNQATVKDIVDLRKTLTIQTTRIEQELSDLKSKFQSDNMMSKSRTLITVPSMN